jgi:exodeoxyribonuclease VII small subunit
MVKKKTASAGGLQPTGEEPTFEEALEELESIVRRLEQGGGALEVALTDYAAAIGLLKNCNQRLERAERRVEMLSGVDAQGNPLTRPVEESEASLLEKQQSRSGRRSAMTGPNSGEATGKADEAGLF